MDKLVHVKYVKFDTTFFATCHATFHEHYFEYFFVLICNKCKEFYEHAIFNISAYTHIQQTCRAACRLRHEVLPERKIRITACMLERPKVKGPLNTNVPPPRRERSERNGLLLDATAKEISRRVRCVFHNCEGKTIATSGSERFLDQRRAHVILTRGRKRARARVRTYPLVIDRFSWKSNLTVSQPR